jgi:branched-chain amino acid transport system permease protein
MGDQLLQYGFSGFVVGCIYAIAASGLVLTYTTTGVFNFAHGAIGGFCAFAYWWVTVEHDVPPLLGLAIVVLGLAPLIGVVLERLVFRRFTGSPVETKLVVSIALTLFTLGLTNQLFDVEVARRLPALTGTGSFEVGSLVVTSDQVAFLLIALAAAISLRYLLFHTRLGTTMRAVVDSPELAELSGARSTTAAQASWAIGCSMAAVCGILIASGRSLQSVVLAFLVLNAYAAAVTGRLKNLPATFGGAIALGMVMDLSNAEHLWGTGDFWNRLRLGIPAIFLFVAMLALPMARLRSGRPVASVRPPPPSARASLLWAVGAVGGLAVLAPALPDDLVTEGSRALVLGIVMLSLVLVTGYAGQVSLATYTFMAVGATIMGSTLADTGASPVGLIVAPLVAAPLGALVALPTIRLQGLYVALATFAFALLSRELLVGDPRVLGLRPRTIQRPDLGFVDLSSDRAFLVFLAASFAVVGIALLAIRRGAFGRRLTALRDSESAAATLGMDVRATKLAVFTISAAIAGFGGALFGSFSLVVTDINFEPIANLVVFLYVVVGGVTTVTGALIGGGLFALLTYAQAEHGEGLGGLVFAGVGLSAIALGGNPGGLAEMLMAKLRRFRPERSAVRAPDVAIGDDVLVGGEGR